MKTLAIIEQQISNILSFPVHKCEGIALQTRIVLEVDLIRWSCWRAPSNELQDQKVVLNYYYDPVFYLIFKFPSNINYIVELNHPHHSPSTSPIYLQILLHRQQHARMRRRRRIRAHLCAKLNVSRRVSIGNWLNFCTNFGN